MNTLSLFFFGIYPYIAITVCVLGCIFRYDREPYTWKADSSQMLSKKGTRLGNNLFHVGMLGIVGGHLVGMLTPHSIYVHFITSGQKQVLAMVAGGGSGLLIVAGLVLIIRRRFTDPRVSKTSSFGDKAIVILLLAQVLLGLLTVLFSFGHLDGHAMEGIGEYFQSGFTFSTFAGYEHIKNLEWVYKLHIILGFTIMLVVPFTRLVHMFSAPVWYLFRNYQVVRSRRHRVKEMQVK